MPAEPVRDGRANAAISSASARCKLLAPGLVGVPDDEINKITHENAMRLFSYDPFVHLPKDQCTVGALRALATDVDVREKAVTGAQPRDPSEPPITVMTLAAASTAKKS